MVYPPTIAADTGSWARRRETSRADVRPTHRATVRSDERARPPRRYGRARPQLDHPPQAPGSLRAKANTKTIRLRWDPCDPLRGCLFLLFGSTLVVKIKKSRNALPSEESKRRT
jgi:hypothetical protein